MFVARRFPCNSFNNHVVVYVRLSIIDEITQPNCRLIKIDEWTIHREKQPSRVFHRRRVIALFTNQIQMPNWECKIRGTQNRRWILLWQLFLHRLIAVSKKPWPISMQTQISRFAGSFSFASNLAVRIWMASGEWSALWQNPLYYRAGGVCYASDRLALLSRKWKIIRQQEASSWSIVIKQSPVWGAVRKLMISCRFERSMLIEKTFKLMVLMVKSQRLTFQSKQWI